MPGPAETHRTEGKERLWEGEIPSLSEEAKTLAGKLKTVREDRT